MGQESVVRDHDQVSGVTGQRSRVTGQRSLSGITGQSRFKRSLISGQGPLVKPFTSGVTGQGSLGRVKGHWTLIRDP